MADIGEHLEKVDGKYYIYKKAKVAFEKMMVAFKTDNPAASLTIVSGYYSKFQVLEELRKILKIKGKDTTDATTKELLVNVDTIQSLAEEDEKNYTKILTYIKATTAEEYEPTILPTLDSASTPSIKIRQIPTLEIKKFKDVDDINDIRKSGRIVTPAADDMKAIATRNWLLNNSYKYGFLLYLDVALYYIGSNKIEKALTVIKPATPTDKLTDDQIREQNSILRNIIGKYQTSMDAVNAIATIDATAFLATIVPPGPIYGGKKGPYAGGNKPPTAEADGYVFQNKTKLLTAAQSPGGGGANDAKAIILSEADLENYKNKIIGNLGSPAATNTSIILHLTAGNPAGAAIQTVKYLYRPYETIVVSGTAEAKNQVFKYTSRSDNWGLHYAVGSAGDIAKGGDEKKYLITSNDWNGHGIGIEMVSLGAVNPILTGTTPEAFNTTYPPSPNTYKGVIDGKKIVQGTDKLSAYPYKDAQYKNEYNGGKFEWVNLGFKYNGHQYYQEFTEELITSLEVLMQDIISRYPNMKSGITGVSVWKVFGLLSKPQPGGNYFSRGHDVLGGLSAPGVFAHSTGGARMDGTNLRSGAHTMHSDTAPTPRLIAMLVRLGYQDI